MNNCAEPRDAALCGAAMATPNRSKRTDRAETTFLRVFSETCNVSEACRAANIGRRTAYEWRDADPEFRAKWDEAEQSAIDTLEKVAWDRAKAGVSDRMLEILLKAHRPDKYVERQKTEHSGHIAIERIEREFIRPGGTA